MTQMLSNLDLMSSKTRAYILGNGKMGSDMERANNFGKMDQFMKAIGTKTWLTDTED